MSRTLKKEDGDLYINPSNGRGSYITGNEKLAQDVADVFMTIYDPERGYGFNLATIEDVNSHSSSLPGFSVGLIRSEVRDALERLEALQGDRSYQLNSYEAIKEIGTVHVYQASRTGYTFYVNVVPAAGGQNVKIGYRINLRHQFTGSPRNLPGTEVTGRFLI